jgi:diaminopimelate decarboxylase
MNCFVYRNGALYAEDVPVAELAERHGTPLYVYSRRHLRAQFRALAGAMADVAPLLAYSVKANSNGAVIRTFADLGAGADVVSGGELFRALRAGVPAERIVFAGVGKTEADIDYALRQDILFFTVESEPEAERISRRAARMGIRARIAFRLNPDVDPRTHKYISTGKKENKFGLDIERFTAACEAAARLPNVDLAGLHMHIGSQILSAQPFAEALAKACDLCRTLRGRHHGFRYVDIGGGIGIQYKPDQAPLSPEVFARTVMPPLTDLGLAVVMEPGRFLVGNAGILVTRVQYVKDHPLKKFVVVDAAMNDLIRPALYQAHHEISAVVRTERTFLADIVGPICESGDFLAQEREVPAVDQGDLLAVHSAGAYGFAMSSTYNSRPRAAEILVDGSRAFVVRERETWEDLVLRERFAEAG